MFCLRLILAARVFQNGAFFLLDDALLHSDWQRRKQAVDILWETVKQGHQIIYFTMDDYTKSLFLEKAGRGSEFKLIEL